VSVVPPQLNAGLVDPSLVANGVINPPREIGLRIRYSF
jgi:hypothetical protein